MTAAAPSCGASRARGGSSCAPWTRQAFGAALTAGQRRGAGRLHAHDAAGAAFRSSCSTPCNTRGRAPYCSAMPRTWCTARRAGIESGIAGLRGARASLGRSRGRRQLRRLQSTCAATSAGAAARISSRQRRWMDWSGCFPVRDALSAGLRTAGLSAVGRMPFVKRRLAQRALGLIGDVPEFLKAV